MKIFVKTGVAPDSVNFVDNNNCVIGWNSEQLCCENHQARITGTEPTVKVLPDGAIVDDVEYMTEEEQERHMKGERIFRPLQRLEIADVVIDFNGLSNATIDLPFYKIDPDYFKQFRGAVVFRLVGVGRWGGSEELFVVLENYHNGYYAHGFSLSVGGVKKVSGIL